MLEFLSLEVLGIDSPADPLDPVLFCNLAIASHSSLSSLSKLIVDDRPAGIFKRVQQKNVY